MDEIKRLYLIFCKHKLNGSF